MTATINLASDWLGVDLEVRSPGSYPTTQTGNHRIDEWLSSKDGRVSSALLTSSNRLFSNNLQKGAN
jgi:hypothetical protein